MRSFLPVTLIVVLLAAPVALSQVPPVPAQPTPVYRVQIANAPAEFTGLDAPNATANAPFQVVLTLANVVCPAAETIAVTVTATATSPPPYFSVVAEPAVINFTIDAGPHLEAAGAAGGTGDSAAVARIAGNITSNASVQVSVTASAPAPTGCQGAGTLAAATSEPVTIFANMTAPPPPPAEPTPEEDTPFVGVAAIAVVAVAVALARRRRS